MSDRWPLAALHMIRQSRRMRASVGQFAGVHSVVMMNGMAMIVVLGRDPHKAFKDRGWEP